MDGEMRNNYYHKKGTGRVKGIGMYVLWLVTCIIVTVIFVGPVFWMIRTSFMHPVEIREWPPRLFPSQITFENYQNAWALMNWPRLFYNSILVTVTATVGLLFLSSLAAFAFAYLRFPFKNFLFITLVLATMIVPMQVDLIPRFLMMARWGLVGTYIPVILLALVHGFQIFLYRQFFQGLPKDLFDAAKVDGAGYFRMYWKIAMPLAWPATATLFIFSFLLRWNDFLYPLIYLTERRLYTVQLGLAFFQREAALPVGPLMAASTYVALPTIVVFLIFQRYFVKGIVMTGMKG